MKHVNLAVFVALGLVSLDAHAGLKEDKVKEELETQITRIKGNLKSKLGMEVGVSVDWKGLGDFCKDVEETYCSNDGQLGYAFRNVLEIPLDIADSGAKAPETKALKSKIKSIRAVKATGKVVDVTLVGGVLTLHFPVGKGADGSSNPSAFSKWRKTVREAL